jgi:single-strand DNA-binding protein
MNQVQLIGRLTRDSQLKYTNSGMAIGEFALAVNDRKKQGDDWKEVVSYFDVTLFGRMAEGINQYLTKGKQIGVTGKLEQQRWQNQEGQNRSRVVVIAQHVDLLGGERGEGQSRPPMHDTSTPKPAQGSGVQDPGDEFPDDIPF